MEKLRAVETPGSDHHQRRRSGRGLVRIASVKVPRSTFILQRTTEEKQEKTTA